MNEEANNLEDKTEKSHTIPIDILKKLDEKNVIFYGEKEKSSVVVEEINEGGSMS